LLLIAKLDDETGEKAVASKISGTLDNLLPLHGTTVPCFKAGGLSYHVHMYQLVPQYDITVSYDAWLILHGASLFNIKGDVVLLFLMLTQ